IFCRAIPSPGPHLSRKALPSRYWIPARQWRSTATAICCSPPQPKQRSTGMDMVSLNIASGILASICRDMGVTLMRTSYSTIFSESLDFTCALALPNGEMIATVDFCPAMIGGMPLLIRSCVNEIAIEDLEDGDVILHNDPYRGGLHTPEHTFFKPVFVDG